VLLDSEFKALISSGNKNMWRKREEFQISHKKSNLAFCPYYREMPIAVFSTKLILW